MGRLTEETFWDAAYRGREAGSTPGVKPPRYWDAYAHHVFWDRILATHLEGRSGQSVLEVGSAPGRNLLKLNRSYGLDPWGVEYTDAGAALNRENLSNAGLSPDQVIQADFFDDAFLEEWRERFDIVFSMGFIEHFDDAADVVSRHVDLCRPGGLVIVTVPNMRGLNWAMTRFFRQELIPLHNLEIMDRTVFRGLFDDRLEAQWCDYYGTLHLSGFTTTSPWKRWVLKAARAAQLPVNVGLRAGGGVLDHEHPMVSPFLGFVGTKR